MQGQPRAWGAHGTHRCFRPRLRRQLLTPWRNAGVTLCCAGLLDRVSQRCTRQVSSYKSDTGTWWVGREDESESEQGLLHVGRVNLAAACLSQSRHRAKHDCSPSPSGHPDFASVLPVCVTVTGIAPHTKSLAAALRTWQVWRASQTRASAPTRQGAREAP